eukprot:4429466-Pleurochrysis_carterae.AAC.1
MPCINQLQLAITGCVSAATCIVNASVKHAYALACALLPNCLEAIGWPLRVVQEPCISGACCLS